MKTNFLTSQLIANRLLNTSKSIQQSLQRVEEGERRLSSTKDSVQFSFANRLTGQAKSLAQSILGLNRNLSRVETAKTSLSSQKELVMAMREIALEAADSETSSAERAVLQLELQGKLSLLQKVSSSDKFEGLKIQSNFASELFSVKRPTGTYQFSQTIAGSGPTELADVTGNGLLDRVVRDNNSDTVRVSFGNGAGGFSGGVSIGANVTSFDIGDVSGNGVNDIVTMGSDGIVSIFEFDGEGSFHLFATSTGPALAKDAILVKVGDLTGNGRRDILIKSETNEIEIFENEGDGSFSSTGTIALGIDPARVELVDLDNDGVLDIFMYNSTNNHRQAFLNDGSGNFTSSFLVDAFGFPQTRDIILGDFTGNGNIDYIIYNAGFGTSIQLYEGNGNGTFSGVNIGSFASAPRVLRAFDYNGNGSLDLLMLNNARDLILLTNSGTGSFSITQTIATNLRFDGLAIGDLNQNGFADIVSTSSTTGSNVYLAKTETRFSSGALQVQTKDKADRTAAVLDGALAKLTELERQIQLEEKELNRQKSSRNSLKEVNAEAQKRLVSLNVNQELAKLGRLEDLQEAQKLALAQTNVSQLIVLDLLRSIRLNRS